MDSSDMSTQSHSTVEFDSIDKSGTKSQLRKPRSFVTVLCLRFRSLC